MRYFKPQTTKNEDGLVALFVVGIIIILLSLTTVSFTKLMGRESRQSLDRELSVQAYYAAQSGINDAADYVNKFPNATLGTTSCGDLASKGYPAFLGPPNTVTDGVDKVTCVTINTAPGQLNFQIPAGQSKIFKMTPSNNYFGRVLFSWDNVGADRSSFPPADYKNPGKTFYTDASWNSGSTKTAPVLEVTYYPMLSDSQSVATLQSRARTIYLYPSRGGTSSFASTGADGSIVGPSCQASTNLNASFDGATAVWHCNTIVTPSIQPGGASPQFMFVKISAFYSTAKVIVQAVDNVNNKATNIEQAQIVLDSTGQGGADVLKRLQTILDYNPPDSPADAVQSIIGLCKRLEYNLSTGIPQLDSSVGPIPDGDGSDTNRACHTADIN